MACAVLIAGCSSGGSGASQPSTGPPSPSSALPPNGAGSFALTGALQFATSGHTATVLNSAKVLIAGGDYFPGIVTATAQLYDPASATFSITGSLNVGRSDHTATLLDNGKVLIAGGHTDPGGVNLVTPAELYDPATGRFSLTGSMNIGRLGHTATRLNNGKVLIAGGATASAELYDPATGTFTSTGSMGFARADPTATLLNNGKVLFVDGETGASATAELYDPASGSFAFTGKPKANRVGHTATLLNNGDVLITGGLTLDSSASPQASAELYDPSTGTFTLAGNMTTARSNHAATLLSNGLVLITGGVSSLRTAASELYDPSKGTFTATTNMNMERSRHTATLLNNGDVLIAGGNLFLVQGELYLPGTFAPVGLVSIAVTPTSPTLSAGSVQQFVATGTFSDNSTQILRSMTWTSSNPAVATISNDVSNHGVAMALAAGISTISASTGAVTGSAVLNVQ